jgi:uncharacterized peroxidase-related enzyme
LRQLHVTAPDLSPEQHHLLTQTRAQLGKVPNLYATIANGPAALRGYLALREALAGGALSDRTREQLALLVAQDNGCAYCVAAHTLRGTRLHGMSEAQLEQTRHAHDDDPHTDAVLRVARAVLRTGGRVDDVLVDHARQAGVTDEELMEIVGHVALNVFSNYANHLAQPDLDFPPVAVEPRPAMPTRAWQHADEVTLADGYQISAADGTDTAVVSNVDVSFEGGFVHLRHPGADLVQTVSAPAVLRIRSQRPTAGTRQ